jgi:sulfoxide reductase heme-binding subunit YedZ
MIASQLTWFVTRGSGAVALLMLTVSFVLGIPTVLSSGSRLAPRVVVQQLHRNISLLVVVFLFLHVATSVLDTFVDIRWIDVVVPFVSHYRPGWLGLGAISLDLMVAVIVTSLFRTRLSYRSWRMIHLSAYACWPIAFVHSIGVGTDRGQRWSIWLSVGCAGAVVIATAWRLVAIAREREQAHHGGLAGSHR